MSTGKTQSRKYYVIVVHHGLAGQTKRAVSLLLEGDEVPTEIIVVNQGGEMFECEDKKVAVIGRGHNSGYSAGFNMGMGALLSRGVRSRDIVIAMNNDVSVEAGSLKLLKKWWRSQKNLVLAGVFFEDGARILSGMGQVNLWTGRAKLWPPHTRDRRIFRGQDGLGAGFPPTGKSERLNARGRYMLARWASKLEGFGYVNYINGAFMAAPYELWLKTRGLPEKYFLYWEDVWVSREVRRLGHELKIVPGLKVRHGADNRGESQQQLYYLVRNGAYWLERETNVVIRQGWRVLNWLRIIYQVWRADNNGVVLRALMDAKRGNLGKIRESIA